MSRVSRTFGLMAIGLALSFAPSLAKAVVIIDTFDQVQTTTDTSANGAGVGNSSAAAASIIGSIRDVFADKTSPAGNSLAVTGVADAAEGSFSVERGPGVAGDVLVSWDGAAAPPSAFDPTSNLQYLLNADLTQAGTQLGILIRLTRADLVNQTLTLTLFSGNTATNYSTQTQVINSVAPPTVDFLFPWGGFAGVVGSANPASISAITLGISGGLPGADLSIDLLQTYAPEPASASLLGLGFVATIARFRRRRVAAKSGQLS